MSFFLSENANYKQKKIAEHVFQLKLNNNNNINAPRYHPFLNIVSDLSSIRFDVVCDDSKLIHEETYLKLIEKNFLTIDENNRSIKFLVNTSDYEIITEKLPPNVFEFFKNSLLVIKNFSPILYASFKNLISFIVPISSSRTQTAMSSGFTFGAIYMSIFDRILEKDGHFLTAIDLAHELGHHALMLYNHCDKLISNWQAIEVFSCIRQTNRPALSSLHACVASIYMMDLYNNLQNSIPFFKSKYLHQTFLVEKSLLELKSKCSFTLLGNKILNELFCKNNEYRLFFS